MRLFCSLLFLFACQILFAQSPIWNVEAHPDGLQVNELGYTQDGSKIIVGTNCHPAKIRYYDAANGDLLWDYTLSEDLFCVMGVGISSTEKYICAVEEFGNIIVFDNQQFPPDSIGSIDLGADYAFSIDFSPVAEMAAVGASNGKMLICNLNAQSVEIAVPAHHGWVTEVAYNQDGTLIYTGGEDGKIKIWTNMGTIVDSLEGHTSEITALELDHNQNILYSSSRDKTIKKWDLAQNQLITNCEKVKFPLYDAALSSDGKWLASTSFDGIHFLDASTMTLVDSLEDNSFGIGSTLGWSDDDNELALGTQKGNLVVYDARVFVGIDEKEKWVNLASIYPNPSSGQFSISFPIVMKDIQLTMHNAMGQQVGTWSFSDQSSIEINTELPLGVYSIFIAHDEGMDRISLVLE